MILQLCTVNDGDNVVNKTLTNILELNVRLKKDFDIENPTLVLSGVDYTTYLNFNYCVIPDLNRSYFINNSEQINNRVVKLNCSCDVLETYKNDFLGSNARFYRNIKTGDYVDGKLELSTKKTVEKFDSSVELVESTSMILVTIEG